MVVASALPYRSTPFVSPQSLSLRLKHVFLSLTKLREGIMKLLIKGVSMDSNPSSARRNLFYAQ